MKKAILSVYKTAVFDSINGTAGWVQRDGLVYVQKMVKDWNEQDYGWQLNTWNGKNWYTMDPPIAEKRIYDSTKSYKDSIGFWIDIDVTTLVKNIIVQGAPNYGFMIGAVMTDSCSLDINDEGMIHRVASKENPLIEHRPKLTISDDGETPILHKNSHLEEIINIIFINGYLSYSSSSYSGGFNIKLFSLRGQEIYNKDLIVERSLSKMDFNREFRGALIAIVTLKNGISFSQKLILK